MAVVLVTGGSSGIGLAIVRRLAAAGNRVFTASRDPGRTELPDGVTPLVLDVADETEVRAAVGRVVEDAGRIDVLINNAGTSVIGALEDITDAEAHQVLEVNLFGPLRMIRAALPIMRAQGDGYIINVSSVNDVVAPVFGGWYSASKAALTSIGTVLDQEVHHFGIRVTTLSPGFFESEMSAGLVDQPIPDDSAYRTALAGLRAFNATRVPADPAAVGDAIHDLIRNPDPPVRVVVGTDGEAMDRYMRETPPAEATTLMRDLTARLWAGGSS